MNRYLLSIGSNFHKESNIKQCCDKLELLFPGITFSEIIESEPVGNGYINAFHNLLALFTSNDEILHINARLKAIENELDRLPEDKSNGIVKIDLDLLTINNTVIKPEDFERKYIQQLLEKFVLGRKF